MLEELVALRKEYEDNLKDKQPPSQSRPSRVRQQLSVFNVEGDRRIYDWSCHRQQPN